MASLTEETVRVTLELTRRGELSVIVNASSHTNDGTRVRSISGRDITGQMSEARLAGINDLFDDIESKIKTLWEIP